MPPKPQSALDTNILLRFLLKDHPRLSPAARVILQHGTHYLDEVVFAEVIWVLESVYRHSRPAIVTQLRKLLSLSHLVNPRKFLLLQALQHYSQTSLDYLDCWLIAVSQAQHLSLDTFDKKLLSLLKKL